MDMSSKRYFDVLLQQMLQMVAMQLVKGNEIKALFSMQVI
jgi:hypothetical protein